MRRWPRVLNTAQFVAAASRVHNYKYDYSEAEYIGSDTPLRIKCPIHGVFNQTPDKHCNKGRGCHNCGAANNTQNAKLTTAEFIRRARLVHSLAYDYSLVEYTGATKKVIIVCPEHGLFTQAPTNHLVGNGCRLCGRNSIAAKLFLSTTQFIERANAIHGTTYDYSCSQYSGHYELLNIMCSTHGLFTQKAGLHLGGSGCPDCNKERLRLGWAARANGRLATLYFLRFYTEEEVFYKIGVTYKSVALRYAGKKYSSGYQYEVLALHRSLNATAVYDWEQSILESFKHLRYQPKQHFYGNTECFSSADDILRIFPL